jgi:hypothetical protein
MSELEDKLTDAGQAWREGEPEGPELATMVAHLPRSQGPQTIRRIAGAGMFGAALLIVLLLARGLPFGQLAGARPSPSPWWAVGGPSACGRPALYRLEGHLTYLGGCDDNLGYPPTTITVLVGQTLDIHMTPEVIGGPPLYPLPVSADPDVVQLIATQDASTATFKAVSIGTTVLMTNGTCSGSVPSAQFEGPCPVAQVEVTTP